MLNHHDLAKLETRGFRLREEFVGEHLDGMSATLPLGGALRLQIYQGCEGTYQLKGQGRGRPKQYELVDYEWFTPTWYLDVRQEQGWTTCTKGAADTVDLALQGALARCRELFPNLVIPPAAAD